MDTEQMRKKIHKICGAIGVVSGFIHSIDPSDEDGRLYKEAAQTSLKKITEAIDELSDLIGRK